MIYSSTGWRDKERNQGCFIKSRFVTTAWTLFTLLIWRDFRRVRESKLGFPFFFFLLIRTTPTAYGDSQARSLLRATAASLCHSSQECRILKPLSEARDWTCNLLVPSCIHFRCATMRTPKLGIPNGVVEERVYISVNLRRNVRVWDNNWESSAQGYAWYYWAGWDYLEISYR